MDEGVNYAVGHSIVQPRALPVNGLIRQANRAARIWDVRLVPAFNGADRPLTTLALPQQRPTAATSHAPDPDESSQSEGSESEDAAVRRHRQPLQMARLRRAPKPILSRCAYSKEVSRKCIAKVDTAFVFSAMYPEVTSLYASTSGLSTTIHHHAGGPSYSTSSNPEQNAANAERCELWRVMSTGMLVNQTPCFLAGGQVR